MTPVLVGIETEYGLAVEGRGAADQIDDAMSLVRGSPDGAFLGWDYRWESPRADLRGFRLDRLAIDPEDARFDQGRSHGSDREVRSDRVLANGARFYNDHGHPEYATPECWTARELVFHDLAGEAVVLRAARELAEVAGRAVRVYKNNTDFHGAGYGTHESYLTPRRLGHEGLYRAVTPILVARQIVCGAGKVGSEHGARCDFQLSQRADFFVEPANAETLYRRPVFNTRDEPHGDPREWIRLHVIAGDANRIPTSTRLKVELVRLAVRLAAESEVPAWALRDPVRAFQSVSRDVGGDFRIELDRGSWTTAYDVIESYLAAAEATLELSADECASVAFVRDLLASLRGDRDLAARHVDWVAKHRMLESYRDSEGSNWDDPMLQSLDLEYSNVDPGESLFAALVDMGEIEMPDALAVGGRETGVFEDTRARARALAVTRYGPWLQGASWGVLTFELEGRTEEIHLDPSKRYGLELERASDVREFIDRLKEIQTT
ncbi:MAG TPA: proteasome accessory factor PafA2 family protein [Fimbriimonadaceae bacterium]|nr:proteasome accessory factor PafA2 family protein [Fimbriimonadaceae bacterium]